MSHSLTTSGLDPDPTAEVTQRIEELSSVEVKRIQQIGPDKWVVIYRELHGLDGCVGPNQLVVVTIDGQLNGKWHLRCGLDESAWIEFDKIVQESEAIVDFCGTPIAVGDRVRSCVNPFNASANRRGVVKSIEPAILVELDDGETLEVLKTQIKVIRKAA